MLETRATEKLINMTNTNSKKSDQDTTNKDLVPRIKKYVVPSILTGIIFLIFTTLFCECVQTVHLVLFWVGYGISALMIVPASFVVVYHRLVKNKNFRDKFTDTNNPKEKGDVWERFERFFDTNAEKFHRIIPMVVLLVGIFLSFNAIYFSHARSLVEFGDWIAYSFIAVVVMTAFALVIFGASGLVNSRRVMKLGVIFMIGFAFVGLFMVPSAMTLTSGN